MRKVKLIAEYRKNAAECEAAGYPGIAAVNAEMAQLLQKELDSAKRDEEKETFEARGYVPSVDFDNNVFRKDA